MYWQKMKRNFFKNEDVHSRNPQVLIFGHWQPMTLLRRELQLSDLKIIFESDLLTYPEEKHKFLLDILVLYELAYPYDEYNNEDKKILILPAY